MLLQSLNILPFDKESGFISGKLSAELKMKGKPIGQNDLLIASIVLSNNLRLVTKNKKHFEAVSNLKIEEW